MARAIIIYNIPPRKIKPSRLGTTPVILVSIIPQALADDNLVWKSFRTAACFDDQQVPFIGASQLWQVAVGALLTMPGNGQEFSAVVTASR